MVFRGCDRVFIYIPEYVAFGTVTAALFISCIYVRFGWVDYTAYCFMKKKENISCDTIVIRVYDAVLAIYMLAYQIFNRLCERNMIFRVNQTNDAFNIS